MFLGRNMYRKERVPQLWYLIEENLFYRENSVKLGNMT